MQPQKRIIFILAVLTILVSSCQKEEPDWTEWSSTAYSKLVQFYRMELFFKEGRTEGDSVTLKFAGGGSVNVPASDFKITNCTFMVPEEVAVQYGTWYVGGRSTGIPFNDALKLEETIPVYAYFNATELMIYASNGDVMSFYPDETDALVSFEIKKQFNPQLESDIHLESDGNLYTGITNLGAESLSLIPTFVVKADYVTVNGVKQISSLTPQDFSKPVTYTIHRHNGDTFDVTVSLTMVKCLPSVFIKTDWREPIISKTSYITGTVRFDDPSALYSDVTSLECSMSIRGRGNTSWTLADKKPYRIKLDEQSKVFGMHKDRDWVLLANYSDKSLVRNLTAMELSRICQMKWTPEMRSVNVTINDKYWGVYTLAEHREVNGHKVDIQLVTPDDNSGEALTGGYYLEIETKQDGIVNFYTSKGIPIIFNDPENPTNAQIAYVKKYLSDFERALYSADFKDPERGYAAYINVDSFINFFIVQEVAKNIDGNLAKSCFMTKERGKKLEMSNVWDFDLAFGNCNYIDQSYPGATNTPEGWFIKDYVYTDYRKGPSDGWFGRMFKDPAFTQRLKERWNELKPQLDGIPQYIDRCVEELYGEEVRNFEVNPILGVYVWPNYKVFQTYGQEVNYLKTFYVQRVAWLDQAINAL